jgi:hypothetical protein
MPHSVDALPATAPVNVASFGDGPQKNTLKMTYFGTKTWVAIFGQGIVK